jgi:hypothetical protein
MSYNFPVTLMQHCIVTMAADNQQETTMQNMDQHPQHMDNVGIDQFIAGFNGQKNSTYHKIADQIITRIHGNNAGIDYEMIETFHFCLLPVTSRDWKCKQ